MNTLIRTLGILCAAGAAQPALASDFKAYLFAHDFDYTEYGDSGEFLDGETGWLPGFGLSYAETKGVHGMRAKLELAGGTVDYDGHTQSGLPHQTETDTFLFRFGLDYEYTPDPGAITFLIGADYAGWDRDIQPAFNPLVGGTVGGLLEEYRWWEVHAGVDATVYRRNRHIWALRGEALYIADPRMTVVDFGDVELDLGAEPGYRLTGRYLHESPAAWSVGVEAFFEEWEFGRSDNVTVGSVTLFEPRSETSNAGIRLLVQQRF